MKTIQVIGLLAILCVCAFHMPSIKRTTQHATHAQWNGQRYVCPANTDMWTSEQEAIAGHDDYVYCVEVSR